MALVSRSRDRTTGGRSSVASFPHVNLPDRLLRMVGRDDDVLALSARLIASRFVTIVGPGGVGKTTVAVAVAHHLFEVVPGAVLFVDLGMLSDPDLVATPRPRCSGCRFSRDDPTPSLIAIFVKSGCS